VKRRTCLVLCLLGLLAALLPATARTAAGTRSAGVLDAGVLAEINAVRAAHGLSSLRASGPLGAAARHHSEEMLADAYFSHDSPDGSAFWRRVQGFYGPTGAATWSVGENLLWASSPLEAKRAVALWMASPGHRRTLLTPTWREVGIAAVSFASARGPWGRGPVTIVTADFGVRS